jgi:uncharacterized membrane protein YdjX (TVP38/TMEM64 family)
VNDDERDWRGFAAATMLLFFFGLLVFVAVFDAFLRRFMPVFLGLLCVALLGYALVALIVRTIVRVRRASHTDGTDQSR